MAPTIEITEQGKQEMARLGMDPHSMMDHILQYIPRADLVGLPKVVFADKPVEKGGRQSGALATYFPKHGMKAALIEIYITNLFDHIKSPESFKLTLPIQLRALARIIFHEVGQHVRQIQTHGVGKNKSELFAESYTKRLLATYLLHNAPQIDRCFDTLESVAAEKGLSMSTIQRMKEGWLKERQDTLQTGNTGIPR